MDAAFAFAAAASAVPQATGLQRLMGKRALHPVFQPIFDLAQGRHFACEALIRGPEHDSLHLPEALFAAAIAEGRTYELEWMAVETAIAQFAAQRSALRLFVNMSIGCLHSSRRRLPDIRRDLMRLGISPSRIVVEITENESVTEYSDLQDLLRDVRRLGIQIAMDDMGEGFSNLRMWSDVRPEFVKIDRHFVSDIDSDPLKLHFVQAMHEIAEVCGSALIAEGVETRQQLSVLRRLGINFFQGFGIARPHREIAAAIATVPTATTENSILVLPLPQRMDRSPRIGQLTHELQAIGPDCDNDSVYRCFEADPLLTVVPVVADGQPLGIITRNALIDRFARPYRREIYGRRSCTTVMDPPQLFEEDLGVQGVARTIGALRGNQIGECFIVTRNGLYRGVGYLRELMGVITDLQIQAARYANPLTQLPGNVPINEHLEELLAASGEFVAAYCDLDHFKPFNDAFGYLRGDQLIQSLGRMLVDAAADHDDFIGHVGGDDFVVLMQSADWESRLRRVMGEFDNNLGQHLGRDYLSAGGYRGEDRRGNAIFHPLPALSIGCVIIKPDTTISHHDVSTALGEAKKEAKRIPGSALFVERRQLQVRGGGPSSSAVAVSPAPTIFGPQLCFEV